MINIDANAAIWIAELKYIIRPKCVVAGGGLPNGDVYSFFSSFEGSFEISQNNSIAD